MKTRDEQILPSLICVGGAHNKVKHSGEDVSAALGDFGAVYDSYFQPVYRYILSKVRNVQEAEDITSQTFLAALESRPCYREQSRLAAWIFTIARHKIVDSIRRRPPLSLAEADDLPAMAEDLPDGWDRESLLLVRMHLFSLPEHEQELIRLRYVAGLPFSDIAVLVGKRKDAVKKSLYRLIARLQHEVEDRDE